MAANKLRLGCLKLFPRSNICNATQIVAPRLFYCTSTEEGKESPPPKGKFAEFYKKELELKEGIHSGTEPQTQTETFASLLRNSKFIDLGDPIGKEVIGVVYHVVGDDLYIDFGWKFPTVCTAPRNYRRYYTKGTRVRLLIKDLELSTKFLGSKEETTLLEADCLLLGLAKYNPKTDGK